MKLLSVMLALGALMFSVSLYQTARVFACGRHKDNSIMGCCGRCHEYSGRTNNFF